MKTKKGKFIVFEGIDGAGAETQSNLLFQYFKGLGEKIKKVQYPDYKGPIGKLISQYLHKKYNFSREVQLFLYLADFLKDKDKIKKWLKEGETVISDRYIPSVLAYQSGDGLSFRNIVGLLRLINFPQPDIIFYLEVSPNISIKRKKKEKRKLDRNEKDRELLIKTSRIYKKLAKKDILGKWVVVNGEKSEEEIFKKIKKIIELKYEI